MNKSMSVNNVCVSILGASMLFLLTAVFTGQAQATPVQGNTITAAPVQLAWWGGGGYYRGGGYYHGNGYYNRGWGGYNRVYACPRVCWRNAWGKVHCARRC